jgi:hypothetical protein
VEEIVLAFGFGKIGLFMPGVRSAVMFRKAIFSFSVKISAHGLLGCGEIVYITVRNFDPGNL